MEKTAKLPVELFVTILYPRLTNILEIEELPPDASL